MTKESMIKVLRYKAEHIKTRIKPKFFLEVADALEQQSEDAISKKEAIDIVRHECGEWKGLAKEIVKQFNGLPLVQPKPKMGHWIYGENEYGIDGYHCDKCGFFVPWDYAHKFINYIKDYKFCPKCNARMVELQESEE
jgi:hypothetical protein